MVQVITVGDPHVSDKAPDNATDSYTDDIIEMLVWIADEAKRREVDAVILLGDIFHHKAPSRNSHQLVQKMIDVVICGIRRRMKPLNIAIDTIWGVGYSMKPPSREAAMAYLNGHLAKTGV